MRSPRRATAADDRPGHAGLPPSPAPRRYRDESDWWRIRELLQATHRRAVHGWNWEIRRWDGDRFHEADPPSDERLAERIWIWETADGRLLGAVHSERPGGAWLELDPEARHLEAEMLALAEEHLAGPLDDMERALEVIVSDEDEERVRLLSGRGYERTADGERLRCLDLGGSLTASGPLPDGYSLRATDSSAPDRAAMADLLNASFGRSIHSAVEVGNFFALSPSFRHDLNLVAVAPDGTFAALAGFTYDAANRYGILDPVCTSPEHRRLGLARILILEGLSRLRALGAASASVQTGLGSAANELYAACGFLETHDFHSWRRRLG